MSSLLFDDVFTVNDVDQGRYNKVSRIEATSQSSDDVKLTLDINTELFPCKVAESLTVALASTLSVDGSDDKVANGSWRAPRPDERSLADDYDYVMYGTAYRFEETGSDKIAVYYSFGGLLMRLEGSYRTLSTLKQDNAYILVRH